MLGILKIPIVLQNYEDGKIKKSIPEAKVVYVLNTSH